MTLHSVLRRSLAAALVVAAGCGGKQEGAPACVTDLPNDCPATLLYDPPLFSTIYDKILHPTCAEGLATCHTTDGAKGGLVFENVDDAYALLLGQKGGRARVLPNDPACSLIVIKTWSTDPNFQMPPGARLQRPDFCTIEQWVARGALR